MRITAEEKVASRARILEAAKAQFRQKGFDQATIRDIAAEAGFATGTLFNYFPSKEEIAVALTQETLCKAQKAFLAKRRTDSSLGEDLFLHVATQLRLLKPMRAFIKPAIETALSAAMLAQPAASHSLRTDQLESVASILRDHGVDANRWSMTVPIYWALYVGVLSFWTEDKSPKQEASLAMLDQAVNMFVHWLQSDDSNS